MRRFLQIIFTVLLLLARISAWAQAPQTVDNGQQTQAAIFPGAGCVYKWTNNKPGIGLPASGTGDIAPFTAINMGTTPVVATIKATPVLTSYAYIANQGSNKVTVIDGTTHAAIKTIDIGTTPVGITASPDGKYVYTANNVTNDVSVISTVDNTLVTNIQVGTNPFAIAISPDSKWVYVSNQNGGSISVINTQTNSVITTISPVLSISSLCVSPDGKWVYAATETGTGAKVYVINALNNTIDSTIPIAPSGNDGMVITPDGKTLYFTNNQGNTITAIDLATKAVSTIQVGSTNPTINTGPYGIAINSTGTRLYVVCGYTNEVDIINTANNTVIQRVSTGAKQPFTVSVSIDDKEFYVTERSSNTVDVFSSSNYSKITTIADPSFSDPFSSGNFISKGPGCSGSPVTFTITVNATPPQLTATVATGTISACAGSPSASPNIQQFTLSGVALTAGVTVKAPPKFEVSLNPTSGYTGSLSLTAAAVKLKSTIIYVRSSQTATGTISGDVTITSAGAAQVTVAVNGKINALPTVNAVANQNPNAGQLTTPVNFTGTGNAFMWSNDKPSIGLAASGAGNIAAFTAVNTTTSPVTATVTVTPVSAGLAYITNQGSGNVSVINTASNQVVSTITVGRNPYGAAVTPDGTKLFVINLGDKTVSVINTNTNQVTATLPVGDSPYGITMAPDGSNAYIANLNDNTISVINTTTNAISTIAGVMSPYGIVLSPDGSKMYVTGYQTSKLYVIDVSAKNIIATIGVGNMPWAVAISPDGGKVYVSSSTDSKISVIDATTNTFMNDVITGGTPVSLTVSPDGTEVFVVNATGNTVIVLNAKTNALIATIPVGAVPNGISYNSDGLIYVTNSSSNNVSVINPVTRQVISTIAVGIAPTSLGNFISKGANCTGVPITFTIKVNASTAKITTGTVSGTISACAGSPSANPAVQQFTVSGTGLVGNITATAPANFEVSLSAGSGFSNSVALNQSGGKVTGAVVYVRSAALATAGNISDNVILTSAGAATQNVAVYGVINALPTVASVPDQIKANGQPTDAVNFTGAGNTFTWTNDNPSIGLASGGTGDIASFTAINTGNGVVKATVTVTPLIVPYAYIANNASNDVSVINTLTNKIITKIQVGGGPAGVAVSRDGTRAYVANSGAGSISVINTTTNNVITTVPVGVFPYGIVVSPDGGRVYVANYSSNTISMINTSNYVIEKNFYINATPNGMAISPDGNFLYITSFNTTSVAVVSTATYSLVKAITVGLTPIGVAVSPDGKWLYVANAGENYVSVIDLATNTVATKVTVGAYPLGVSVSPNGGKVYVTNAGSGTVSVIDAATNVVTETVTVGSKPNGLSVSNDGNKIYVTNPNSQNVSVINAADNSVSATIPVTANPNSFGNFITSGSTCAGTPVKFTITVKPAGVSGITAGPVTGTIVACAGSPSASPDIQQFTVSATGLTNDITATAPANFEVSLSAGTGYAHSITIKQSGGLVNDAIVYVRSAASATAGPISDDVVLASVGVASKNMTVDGTVNALPTVNVVGNQTYNNGDLTAAINFTGTGNSYSWVNDRPGIGLPGSGIGSINTFTAANGGSSPVVANITVTPLSGTVAYIANTQTNDVSVVDLTSNSVIATIPVGINPFSVAVNRGNNSVYVSNSGDYTVSVINTTTSTKSLISVGSAPYGLKLNPDGTRIYVANFHSNNVSVINTANNKVIQTISGFNAPVDVALNRDGSRLYVSNLNGATVSVINTANYSLVTTIPVGGSPYNMVLSPDGSKIYVANNTGLSVSVISTATNTVTTTITGNITPFCVAVSPDGSKLYVPNVSLASISIFNTADNSLITTISGFGAPSGISFSGDGKYYYVNNEDGNRLSVVDAATNIIVKDITVGGYPVSMGGNFLSFGSNCDGIPATFTITVNAQAPAITAGPVTGTITACAGSPSASPNIQQFTVSGSGLSGDITAAAPIGFEVSLSATSGFSNNVKITATSGSVTNVTVYVRSADYAIGSVSGDVELSTPGLPSQTVSVRGLVNTPPKANAVSDQTKMAGEATDVVNFTGTGNTYNWTNDNPAIGLPATGTGDIASFTALNPGANPIIANITVTPTVQQIAYVPNSGDGTLSVINIATNTVVATVPVGEVPVGAAVSPDGKKIYVCNHYSSTVSVIDAATNKVVATIQDVYAPYYIVISPDGSKIFAVNNGPGTITVIDGLTNTKSGLVQVDSYPLGIAISQDGKTLYVVSTNLNNVSVIDVATGAVITKINVGVYPEGIVLSPNGSRAYVTNYTLSTVSIINTLNNTVIKTIDVGGNPTAIAISPDGTKVYVSNSTSNSVTVIDALTNSVSATYTAGNTPQGVSLNADGSVLYVTNFDSNNVSVINTLTGSLITTIPVGGSPTSFGNFISNGGGCAGSSIKFKITVNPAAVPVITATGTLSPVTTIYGTPSLATSFTISGSNMREGIKVTPPTGVEVSTDNINFSNTITVGAAGTIAQTTIYVRLAKNTPAGSYQGPIDLTSTGASTVSPDLPVSIVSPAPLTITATNKNKDYGTLLTGASRVTDFTVTGLQNSETAGTVTITYGNGAAANSPVNSYLNSISPSALTGGTFDPKNYTPTYVNGNININKVPLTITADDKSKTYKDPNPILTVTYSGFVNNEGPAQLTSPPVVSTVADETSVPGKYPIIVSGGASLNYNIALVDGVLTVLGINVPLKIPNTFTPNGDGINDTWNIVNIDNYPDCTVNIYNRWGQNVFSSIGYGKSWDGRYKGALLPVSTYYYIIDVKNESRPYSGSITIIR